MGVLKRFEQRIEGAVNGVFARAFKGDVQPVEIAARLQRELDSEAKLMSRDRRLVPNDFTVRLSSHDHDRLVPYSKTLMQEIVPDLKSHAAEMGYVFNGLITIHLELDESLPTGRFTVSSAAVAGVATDRNQANRNEVSTAAINRAQLVLEVNGMRHPLQPPGLVIGRGSDVDLRINDPGISRRHAEIRVHGSGAILDVTIIDLGSTNGIVVNGHRIREAPLSEGSRIEIGSTRMLVHAPAGN